MRERLVTVTENGKGDFGLTVDIGAHRLTADEPVEAGGEGNGPDPYEFVMAGLGACTAMTVRLYARRKQWPLEHLQVLVTHPQQRSEGGATDTFDRKITLTGPLTDEMRGRLLDIATRCPVSKTLSLGSELRAGLADAE